MILEHLQKHKFLGTVPYTHMVTRMYIVAHVCTVAQTYMVVHTYMMAHTHNHSMGGVQKQRQRQQDLGKCEVTLFSVASSRLVNTLSQKNK